MGASVIVEKRLLATGVVTPGSSFLGKIESFDYDPITETFTLIRPRF